MSKFVVFTFISFFRLACTGTSASVSGETRVSSFKKLIVVSFPSRLCDHIELYNVFELLSDSLCDMGIRFLAYRCSWEADSSRGKSSWYPFDFQIVLVSCVEAIVGKGQEHLNDGAVLKKSKLPEVPEIFVEVDLMPLLEVK